MGTATVRRMRTNEAGPVVDLVLRANEDNLAAFPPSVAAAYRAEISSAAARLPFADIYVAELEGCLAGSVTYLPDAAKDGHPWPPGGAVLRFLAVDPPLRGSGLGERLTITCIDRARAQGAAFLGLHTAPLMVAARRIYHRLGFERAPEHDFNPMAHYGGTPGDPSPDDGVQGLAYLLRFDHFRSRL